MSTFLRYSLTLDYKIEHTGSLNVPNAIHKNKIEDGRREETIVVPIQSDVIPALDEECLKYVKEQFDTPYKRQADYFERLVVPGSMAFNSALEIVQWQDLSKDEQKKHLEGGYEIYYQNAQKAVAKAISIFERKRQLDSGAPDPLLVSQTPAQGTGQNENFPSTWIYAKDDGAAVDNSSAAEMASLGLQSSTLTAIQDGFGKVIERQDKLIELQQQTAQNVIEQPPAVDAGTAQTDPAAQTPAASKQAGKEPRAGSGGRKQKNFKLPKGKEGINILLEILRYLRDSKFQYWIADKIGFDKSCWGKEGTLGDCLCKLKQRAMEYPKEDKSDYLFCTALLNELDEAELDPEKDINWREIPSGIINDRNQWEK